MARPVEDFSNAFCMRQEGLTYKQIGIHFGVLGQAARRLVAIGEMRNRKATEYGDNWLFGLSVRTANCLRAERLENLRQVHDFIKKGEYKSIPNLGKKSFDELCAWANVYPEPKKCVQPEDLRSVKAAKTLLEKHGYTVVAPRI